MPSEPSIVRPAVAALVLLAAVALTGVVLFYWWPGGVAMGVAVGAGAVLAVGAQMQRSNARVATDEVLVERLGVPAHAAARRAERTAQAPVPVLVAPRVAVTVPAVAPLHAQAGDAWFSTGADAVPAEPEAAPSVAVAPVETVEQRPRREVVPEPVTDAVAPSVAEVVEPVPVIVEPVAVAPEPAPRPDTQPVPEIAQAVDPGPVPEHDGPDTIPATDFVLTDDSTVRTDLEHLKDELGEDYLDFARAARLVVETQYASAARLQRDLDLPYSRARRLLSDLEEQHFVGPATGSLPRVVLMPKDRLPEVERLLEEV